jgi:cytochrome c-type biogenesis protein CcmH/NrfG
MGSVPDGVYNLVNDTLEVVSAATRGLSAEALQRLIDSVRHASAAHESPEAFAERVAADTPDLAPVVNVFMQQAKGGTWEQRLVTFLTILTVILAYLQWQHPQQPQRSERPPATQEQTVDDADADKIAQEVFEKLQQHPVRPGGEVAKHVRVASLCCCKFAAV